MQFHEEKDVAPYDAGSEHAIQTAKEKGWTVIIPDDNTLLIDIDDDEQYAIHQKRIKRLVDITDFTSDECVSTSGLPHRHIILTTNTKFSIVERLFLQVWLGSDNVKERLSFIRYLNDDSNPTLLVKVGKV